MSRSAQRPAGPPAPESTTAKQSVTIRLDRATVAHFKQIAGQSGIPYQTLINLYLRDCAATGRRIEMAWPHPKARKG